MGIYTRKDTRFMWARYGHRGKMVCESTCETDPVKARAYLKNRLREIGADRLGLRKFAGPAGERVDLSTLFDMLADDYHLRNVKSLKTSLCHLGSARRHFGHLKAVDITPELIDTWIRSQLALAENDRPSAATINRRLAMVNLALRQAHSRGLIAAPCKIRKLSELGRARQGFFEKAEFEAVVAQLPAHLQDFCRFAALTGWRKGEIASLTWQDVDLAGKVIRLRPEHSKNAQGRVLALEGELWELIGRARANTTFAAGYVFQSQGRHKDFRKGHQIGDFRKAWDTACRAAHCPGRLFHDLRRTAVRNMVRAGVPQVVAMSISGHKTVSVFNRYNIVSETDLRDAQAKLQAHLAAFSKMSRSFTTARRAELPATSSASNSAISATAAG